MQYYFFVVGIVLILSALGLLWHRWSFIRTANPITGKVERIRRMNYFFNQEGGPSQHLEIVYQDKEGGDRRYIADNSLLVYRYRRGQPIELAIKNGKVLVNSPLNLYAAPGALLIFGWVMLWLGQGVTARS